MDGMETHPYISTDVALFAFTTILNTESPSPKRTAWKVGHDGGLTGHSTSELLQTSLVREKDMSGEVSSMRNVRVRLSCRDGGAAGDGGRDGAGGTARRWTNEHYNARHLEKDHSVLAPHMSARISSAWGVSSQNVLSTHTETLWWKSGFGHMHDACRLNAKVLRKSQSSAVDHDMLTCRGTQSLSPLRRYMSQRACTGGLEQGHGIQERV